MSAEVFSRDASIWAPFSVPCPSLPYADPDRRSPPLSSPLLPPLPSQPLFLILGSFVADSYGRNNAVWCFVSLHVPFFFRCTEKVARRRQRKEEEKARGLERRETRMNPAT